MKRILFLIKPVSSTYIMRCRRCFYADMEDHRETVNHSVMDAARYQAIVNWAFALSPDARGEGTMTRRGGIQHLHRLH